MATFGKHRLSQSKNGRQIKVAATTTPGTLVHVGADGYHIVQGNTTKQDEVWIYATNQDTSSIALTIEFGGVTSPDDLITVTVPSKSGLMLIVPGLISWGGVEIRAFAGTTNKILLSGYVNRITTD
tara:strand:+ start:2179 stop:2556 length:378 start_codon:yes stop_codon:yes gene_type:complete